jgi:hypothetical protein
MKERKKLEEEFGTDCSCLFVNCWNCDIIKKYPEHFEIDRCIKIQETKYFYKCDNWYFCSDCFNTNPDSFRRKIKIRETKERKK